MAVSWGDPLPRSLGVVCALDALSLPSLPGGPMTRESLLDRLRGQGIEDAALLEAAASLPLEWFLLGRGDDDPDDADLDAAADAARMTALLSLRPTDRVLEVGTGSGYHAALLSRLAAEVCTVELDEELDALAQRLLTRVGADRVRHLCADGADGWEERGPFDAVVVTASVPEVPASLLRQLAPGGRLVAAVEATVPPTLTRWVRSRAGLDRSEHGPVDLEPLQGRVRWPSADAALEDLPLAWIWALAFVTTTHDGVTVSDLDELTARQPLAELSGLRASAGLLELGWLRSDGDHLALGERSRVAADVLEIYERRRPEAWELLVNLLAEGLSLDESIPAALRSLDRRRFVAEEHALLADLDMPLPVSEETTTSAVHAIAMILDAARPRSGNRVLLCGVKGGVTAALAAHLVGAEGRVVCLEWDADLARRVRRALGALEHVRRRVKVLHQADVTIGLPVEAPYNVIIVNGSVPKIPRALLHQLEDDGALLFFMQWPMEEAQSCYVVRKNADIVKHDALSAFQFTPIYGEHGWDRMESLQAEYDRSKLDRESSRALDRIVEQEVTYPLAQAYIRARDALEAAERHVRALRAWEALYKYLAFPCINEVDRAGKGDSDFVERMLKIGRDPSVGTWEQMAERACRLVPESSIGAAVREDMDRRFQQEPVLQLLTMLDGDRSASRDEVGASELFQRVVRYRNQSGEAHGALGSTETLHRNARVLLDALAVVLTQSTVCRKLELVRIERVDVEATDETGQKEQRVYRAHVFRGAHYRMHKMVLEPTGLAKGYTYLVDPASRKRVATMSPWVYFGEGERGIDLFLYNGRDEKRQAVFITHHSTNRWPPVNETNRIDDVMRNYQTRTRVDLPAEQAWALLDRLITTFVSDDVVEASEMRSLVEMAASFGIEQDPAAAAALLRDRVLARYPSARVAG